MTLSFKKELKHTKKSPLAEGQIELTHPMYIGSYVKVLKINSDIFVKILFIYFRFKIFYFLIQTNVIYF